MSEAALTFTIRGHLVSLKNSRNVALNRKTGQLFPVKNAKIVQFSQDFLNQCPQYREPPFDGDVEVMVRVYYPSRRQDLDCALIYDLLQKTGIVKNDRQVKVKYEYWGLDSTNPRVIVKIWRLPANPIRKIGELHEDHQINSRERKEIESR